MYVVNNRRFIFILCKVIVLYVNCIYCLIYVSVQLFFLSLLLGVTEKNIMIKSVLIRVCWFNVLFIKALPRVEEMFKIQKTFLFIHALPHATTWRRFRCHIILMVMMTMVVMMHYRDTDDDGASGVGFDLSVNTTIDQARVKWTCVAKAKCVC